MRRTTPVMTGLSSVSLSLTASADEALISKIASSLEDDTISISWVKTKTGWDIQWVFQSLPTLNTLVSNISKVCNKKFSVKDFIVKDIPEIDWLEESYRAFPPFSIGDFFIFGSHYDGKLPKQKIPLQIDAATAFGSGEHGTTRGCLEALLHIHKNGFKPKLILDMGAGSGILGIAAYKLWKKPVLAVDIDKEATRVACHHRKINDVPAGDGAMICATGDGYAARLIQQNKKNYDLIIANILAGPLVMMAESLSRCLVKNGHAILSGLLVEQEESVLTAHQNAGLQITKRITHDEWRTLIFRKI